MFRSFKDKMAAGSGGGASHGASTRGSTRQRILPSHQIKIVIKGDHNTGKTALFNRLQGKPVPPTYAISSTITVEHCTYESKTQDEPVVNLEMEFIILNEKKKIIFNLLICFFSY